MEYHYREGTPADKQQLQKLGLNSYGQFTDILTEENRNKLSAFLTGENTYSELLSKSKCFVCENNQEIIGMAFLVLSGNPTDIFQEDWCYLRMVGVHTEYAGKGIAKILIQLCINHAKENKEKIMALHTSEFMEAARHIYEKIGFKKVAEIPPRLGKKYWLYTFKL